MRRLPLSPFLFPANDTAPPAPRRATPCAEHMPRPGASDMMALGPAALLAVAAMRAWAAPLMRPDAPHPDWRQLFGLARLAPQGLVGFEVLMTILGTHAQRLIDVHCCACPSLGEDERSMLRLVAAIQAGALTEAIGVLADWLPAEAVGPALNGARAFAAGMVDAGLHLLPEPATLH
jgi:hypothetical protein